MILDVKAAAIYLAKARRMATRSVAKHFKAGAVAVRRGYLLGHGRNCPRTKKSAVRGSRSIHGEADLVAKARDDLDGAVVYVVVLAKSGRDVVSRPCEKCWALLLAAGVKAVVWSNRGVPTLEEMR